jgi:hypothetical protein
VNAPISVPEGLSIYAELAFSCSNRTVHSVAPRPTFLLRAAFAPRPALASGAFFARWSTAVEMPPGQILREHRLVAQKKTAHGAPWTKEDVRELRAHSKARTPLPEIAKKMKRTERALRRKAGILGIGLGHRR